LQEQLHHGYTKHGNRTPIRTVRLQCRCAPVLTANISEPNDSSYCDYYHTTYLPCPRDNHRMIHTDAGSPPPLSHPILFTLALAAGLAAFLATAGCDAARTAPAGRGLNTGHFDLSPEVRRLLPRGAVLYYSKSTFLRRTIRGTEFRWAVERLDIDSGNTQELISTDSSGLIELLPYSVSPDNRHLLLTARTRDRKKVLLELDLNTLQWRTITTDVGMSVYSPDGKLIATYSITYPPGERRNPILRTRIITRDGKLVKELPCKSNRCSHITWATEGTSVFYVDGEKSIVSHSLDDNYFHTMYVARDGHKVHYPKACGHTILCHRASP